MCIEEVNDTCKRQVYCLKVTSDLKAKGKSKPRMSDVANSDSSASNLSPVQHQPMSDRFLGARIFFWTLIVGFGVGFLTGLSVSPVVAIVLSSLLSIVSVATTFLTGSSLALSTVSKFAKEVNQSLDSATDDSCSENSDVHDSPTGILQKQRIANLNTAILATLVIGVSFGAVVGITVRNTNAISRLGQGWWGQGSIQARWQQAGISFDDDERKRIHDALEAEITWWTNQRTGAHRTEESDEQLSDRLQNEQTQVATAIFESFFGYSTINNDGGSTSIGSSSTTLQQGLPLGSVLYSVSIDDSLCRDLSENTNNRSQLTFFANRHIRQNAEPQLDTNSFQDPLLAAGALLWICTQNSN